MHGNRAGATPLPAPAAPSTPAPKPVSEHEQTVLSDGTVIEGWYRNSRLHREGGPAFVKRSPDGTIGIEEWVVGGQFHRTDGPAYVRYRPDGTVESEAWFVDGTEVEPWEVLGRYLMARGVSGLSAEALKQIAKDVPWQRWDELGPNHPLVALWSTVHPSADISAG